MNYPIYFLGVALVCAGSAHAAENKPQAAPPAAAVQTGHVSSMRAYVDPETGELSSVPVTAEQPGAAELDFGFKDSAPVEVSRRADGTVVYSLNGNFEVASQAVIGTDGKVTTVCTDVRHAGQVPHVHAAAAASPEER